jgi:hypothetical protein
MIRRVQTIKDVKTYFTQIIDEGTNIHPDDDFKDIVNIKTGEVTYSKDEAVLRNKLMQECFVVCESTGHDIYDLGLTIHLKKTGLDKFIPLPN